MNSQSPTPCVRLGAYAVAIAGALLIVGWLVHLMQSYTAAPGISATRSAERMQIMSEFQAANAPLVEQYGWQDQARGFVHVPIDRAMEMALQEWQDPAAARSNLMARAAKEFAPAPKLPEKKNEYE